MVRCMRLICVNQVHNRNIQDSMGTIDDLIHVHRTDYAGRTDKTYEIVTIDTIDIRDQEALQSSQAWSKGGSSNRSTTPWDFLGFPGISKDFDKGSTRTLLGKWDVLGFPRTS